MYEVGERKVWVYVGVGRWVYTMYEVGGKVGLCRWVWTLGGYNNV